MKLSKLCANGNDFVIFHAFLREDRSALAKELCNRHKGIGADGMIVILPHENGIAWEFYNSDGSEASMCGNGARAAVAYAYANGLCEKNTTLHTLAGAIHSSIFSSSEGLVAPEKIGSKSTFVEVCLGKPKLIKSGIKEAGREWVLIDTGVPHLLSFGASASEFDKDLAAKLRDKYNANVNYACVAGGELFVRTFERGVEDETLACGTGMAACFFAGLGSGLVQNGATIRPTSKEPVRLRQESDELYLFGEVLYCFEAVI